MQRELSEDELSAIAVFPLPSVVLFPGTTLSLHIFEPRYREMMADCLRDQRMVMAIAQLRPGWRTDAPPRSAGAVPLNEYQGRPPIHDIAGAGRILYHVRRPDGTYDLELEGVSRVRLHELAADRPYRRARAEPLHDGASEDVSSRELNGLLSLATSIVELAQESGRTQSLELLASADDPPARLLDRLAHQFVSDPAARQQLLETLDVSERMHTIASHLAELRLSVVAANESGPRTLH